MCMKFVRDRDSFGLFSKYIGHVDLFEPHLNENVHRYNISASGMEAVKLYW